MQPADPTARLSDQALMALVKPILMSELSEWKVSDMDSKQNIAVYWRPNPNKDIKFCLFMAVADLPISVKEAADLLNKPENRLIWDKDNVEVFEDIGDGLVYTKTKPVMGGLISPRDMVDMRVFEELADGTHICAARSVDSPKRPPAKGAVRAFSYSNGLRITKRGEKACTIRMLGCSDPRGWLFKAMVEGGVPGVLMKMLVCLVREANDIEKKRLTGGGAPNKTAAPAAAKARV